MKTLSEILSYTKLNEKTMCMEWQRCLNTDGYPRMGVSGNSNIKVHRLVYELVHNKDITGLVVRHTCDNPKCINPEHLLEGTASDNAKDRDERGRTYKKITKEIVIRVRELLDTGKLSQREIATIVGIPVQRVSDIKCNRYNQDAKLTRYLR